MFTDASLFYGLYLFQKLIGKEICPNILILYYGIIYVSIHIINYSIIGNENHKMHHTKKNQVYCNYGPDTIDHLFNTNCDNKWEDMTHHIPNIVISYFISSCIYKNT